MTTAPLPPPVPLTGLDCYIDPKDGKVKRYDQARADLEAENKRLREVLRSAEQKLIELEHAVSGGDDEYHVEGVILGIRAALEGTK